MKILLIAVLGATLLAGSAVAGPRFGVYVNLGGGGYGCAPRYYAPPACYVPRPVYCAPRVACYEATPVYYRASAPIVYAPVYRAPLGRPGIIRTVPFGWRR